MPNLQQRAYELKSTKQGQTLVGNKNRRLLVSIPPYFIIAMLRARPPSRGADAGILCWHHGTYTLYHTSTS